MSCRTRRGLATVEFVMVCPLLLLLMAGVFLVARAGVAKAATATRARTDGWDERRRLTPADVFDLGVDPLTHKAVGRVTQRVASGTLFPSTRFDAVSAVTVTDRVWEFRDQTWERRAYVARLHERPYSLIAKTLFGGKLGNLTPAVLLAISVSVTAAGGDFENFVAQIYMAAATVGRILNIAVQIAGYALEILGLPFRLAIIPLEIAKIAAYASFRWGFARKLGRIIDMLETAIDCFENLYRASQGRPVATPFGLGNIRKP